jgi:hypothetical protein
MEGVSPMMPAGTQGSTPAAVLERLDGPTTSGRSGPAAEPPSAGDTQPFP